MKKGREERSKEREGSYLAKKKNQYAEGANCSFIPRANRQQGGVHTHREEPGVGREVNTATPRVS